jgi:tetratricopeptide (TPR) repeat protein
VWATTAVGLPSLRLPSLPSDMHTWALASIDLVYQEDFSGAFEQAKRIIRRYGNHPAGYFFYAAALDAWMLHYQSSSKEDEFYRQCNLAVDKAEELIDRGKADAWVHFFMGGAEGLKGGYEMRYDRWITAFRYGWRAVTILRRLQREHAEMVDLKYGIGTYEYWRSAMTDVMRWLPRVADKRDTAIGMLREAKDRGRYTRITSASALISVLSNEGRHEEVVLVADEMLKTYPRCLLFYLARARACCRLGRYDEAERMLLNVLKWTKAEPLGNHNTVVVHYWLAKVYQGQRRRADCAAECERALAVALSDENRKRLDRKLGEMQELRKAALASK